MREDWGAGMTFFPATVVTRGKVLSDWSCSAHNCLSRSSLLRCCSTCMLPASLQNGMYEECASWAVKVSRNSRAIRSRSMPSKNIHNLYTITGMTTFLQFSRHSFPAVIFKTTANHLRNNWTPNSFSSLTISYLVVTGLQFPAQLLEKRPESRESL